MTSDLPRASPAPDAVVVDLGNVLVRWEPQQAWTGLDPDAVAAFHRDVDFPAWNHGLDGGTPTSRAVADVAARWPQHEGVAATYVANFPATLVGPVPGTRAVVEELRSAGVRLVALTNWSAELFELARPLLQDVVGLDAFEGVVVSGVERLTKPDPAIFRLALERYGLEAGRTAFVDDAPTNVAAARALGLRAVRFTDAATLRTELGGLGLPVRAAGTGVA